MRGSWRLVGTIPTEQDDEWQDGRRSLLPETIAAIDAVTSEGGDATAHRKLIPPDVKTTSGYTTSWDLTGA